MCGDGLFPRPGDSRQRLQTKEEASAVSRRQRENQHRQPSTAPATGPSFSIEASQAFPKSISNISSLFIFINVLQKFKHCLRSFILLEIKPFCMGNTYDSHWIPDIFKLFLPRSHRYKHT